jgi:hypothetical protein
VFEGQTMESRFPALLDGEDDRFSRSAAVEFAPGDAEPAGTRLEGSGAVSEESTVGKDASPAPIPPALDTVTFADLLAAQDLAPDFFAPAAQPANDAAPATADDAPAPVPPTNGLATLTPSAPAPVSARPADEAGGEAEPPMVAAAAPTPVDESTPLIADDAFAHDGKPQSLVDALDAVARLVTEPHVPADPVVEAAPTGDTPTPIPQPAAAGSAWDAASPVPAPAAAGDAQSLTGTLGAAAKLAADANAAAEALENLKRLLERQLPDVAVGLAAPAPVASSTAWTPGPAPEAPRPPPLPPPVSSVREDRSGIRYPQPAPEPHVPVPRRRPAAERSRFDVRGFFAGFALSWAFGVVLYLFMTAG